MPIKVSQLEPTCQWHDHGDAAAAAPGDKLSPLGGGVSHMHSHPNPSLSDRRTGQWAARASELQPEARGWSERERERERARERERERERESFIRNPSP